MLQTQQTVAMPKALSRTAPNTQQPLDAAVKALVARQGQSGSWPGDYGGALFLVPMFVMASRMTGFSLDESTRKGLRSYLLAQQNHDGGFGLHTEGESTVFVTTLSYVALRILDLEPSHKQLAHAMEWLQGAGGPLGIPSWGKLFMCVMGLYSYDGMHPVLPELWLLPAWMPIQPSRLWCHCRVVYLPMSYLYGVRAQAQQDELIAGIRDELYEGRWEDIDWVSQRGNVASTDIHSPHTVALEAVNELQARYERLAPKRLRKASLRKVLDHIRHEDAVTSYINIGPVNQLLNMLVEHFVEPAGPRLQKHHNRLRDYLWTDKMGIRVQGYNSSELWDTTFALQALKAAGRAELTADALETGYRFVRDNQILEDVPARQRYYRHQSKGGWPFSNRPHGWPISDCTAEGIKTALELESVIANAQRIPPKRLEDAVAFLLSMQNKDGGWATYEPQRGSKLLELLNPSEVFGGIMVDYSYPECTSACIQALALFAKRFPTKNRRQIHRAIRRAESYLLGTQEQDGSWYGSWGVCFTYGTWFGVWGLRAAGLPPTHRAIRKARQFVLARQRADGGWGEHFSSCTKKQYVPADKSHAVQTAWALLTLQKAGAQADPGTLRGIEHLRSTQQKDGSWPKGAMVGVFNQTCMLNYDNYSAVFPTWALALAGS